MTTLYISGRFFFDLYGKKISEKVKKKNEIKGYFIALKGDIKNSYAVFDHCLYVYCVLPYFVLYGIFIII